MRIITYPYLQAIGTGDSMYGLREDINLKFFIGRTLENVNFGIAIVQLLFDEETGISVEMHLEHQSKETLSVWDGDQHIAAVASLVHLIGCTITNIETQTDGTLTLVFSNGDVVTLYDDTSLYQAYHIWHGDDPMIVV